MRHVDFSPFYRSTVGFDRLFDLLGSGSEAEANVYPPYNIERLSDNEYRITMAVAGFSQDELKIDVKEQALNVRGEKKAEDKGREFLHRGIAARTFERRFQLADHVEVKGADLKDGLLHIDLVRNVPELLMTHRIAALITHYEGMPLAMLEGMAAGCAVVASAVPGVREVIEDGVEGRLVPERDDIALADALETLLRDDDTATGLSVAARAAAIERHGRDLMHARYEALFLELARAG